MSERGRASSAWAWAVLLGGALAACARHDSPEPQKPAPASANAPAPAPTAPSGAAAPADEATREALRQAHELVASMEQGDRPPAAGAAASAAPTRLLGAFTQEDVARAAGAGADAARRWRAAEWHALKDTIVALSYRHAEFGARPETLEPRVVLVQNRAGKLLPMAEGKLDLSGAACRNDAGEPTGGEDQAPDLALDLAPYEISSGQRAIGVRFTCANTFPAGEGSETRLLLLELHGGALRQVFDATISRTNFDRPSGNQSTTTGVLSVQREQHAGYFDLLLRSKTENEGPTTGTAHNREGQRTRSERFVWNGEHYVASSPP